MPPVREEAYFLRVLDNEVDRQELGQARRPDMFHATHGVFKLIFAIFLVALTVSYAPTAMAQAPPAQKSAGQIANPASENCVRQGGTLAIQKHNDGGEYGVCLFQDDRQCEEWAMFRGECPVGGIKITGYITPAARYCAITGGKYRVTRPHPENCTSHYVSLPGFQATLPQTQWSSTSECHVNCRY